MFELTSISKHGPKKPSSVKILIGNETQTRRLSLELLMKKLEYEIFQCSYKRNYCTVLVVSHDGYNRDLERGIRIEI